jgi:tetratricopeptide (TPR) repeat protein
MSATASRSATHTCLAAAPATARWLGICLVWLAASGCATALPEVTPDDQTAQAAQSPAPAAAAAPGSEQQAPAVGVSRLDAPLFYQLLIGELELRTGEAGTAYEVILDAARRTREPALFRRAVEIALQARAGEQALAAARAWSQALPDAADALRFQLQILTQMNRVPDSAQPLAALLKLTPDSERGGLIAALPRLYQRNPAPQVSPVLAAALAPYADQAATRVPVRLALARHAIAAKDSARALALAREAAGLEPDALGPALIGIELMADEAVREPAEALVDRYLARPDAEPALRLAYVRVLSTAQRYADAAAQLEIYTRQRPDEAAPFLSLGALHLELRHPEQGEAALQRYVELSLRPRPTAPEAAGSAAAALVEQTDEEELAAAAQELATADEGSADEGLVQAYLMLAQSAEQRRDFQAAEAWLARIDDPSRALDVQTRRATILARQGQIKQARELLRQTPERDPADARAKLVAEVGVLRDVERWREAHELLAQANLRFVDDDRLLYEQAMMAEKIDRLDEMESLLRRVMEIKPDNAHAYNALGYSLADRKLRLPEARQLIVRALELAPGDPFITDSLGWVEYRLGNTTEALRLLRLAYDMRPDPEIGAHLGEVLWALGQREEARRVWRQAQVRDADNSVLRETLVRLNADL